MATRAEKTSAKEFGYVKKYQCYVVQLSCKLDWKYFLSFSKTHQRTKIKIFKYIAWKFDLKAKEISFTYST